MEQGIAQALSETLVPDSERIAAATRRLKDDYYVHAECLPALIAIVEEHQLEQIRQLAAVEARKQVVPHWNAQEETVKTRLRSTLLQKTLNEASKLVRHSEARIVAAIAKIDLPQNAWPDLPGFLVAAATSSDVHAREVGVYVLYTLFDTMEELLGDRMGDLFNLFTTTINDGESLEVRATTLLAVGRMAEIIAVDDRASIQQFRALLPSMTAILQQTVEAGNQELARPAFEVFQTLLILEPQLISKHLEDLLRFMVALGSESAADDEYRVLALSWILTCTRYRKKKVKSLRCAPDLVRTMLQIGREDTGDPADEEDNPARMAYRVVDALSTGLPTSHVYEPLLAMAGQNFKTDAPSRKSSLICLGVAVEGAVEYVSQNLDTIMQFVLAGLGDEDREVQRAALLALGQIADELPEDIGARHEQLLPLVFALVQSHGEEVAKSAMNALDAMLESLDKDHMLKYLADLVPAFLVMLRSPIELEIKATVLNALGSAAHSSEDAFRPFVESAMHVVLSLIAENEDVDLRSAAVDCAGAVMAAVGREAFSAYIDKTASIAGDAMQTEHSRLRECAFSFFALLARVLGQDVAPYLQAVVAALFASLDQGELGDEDSTAIEDLNIEEGLEVGDGDDDDVIKSLGFSSAIAIEKEAAAEALGEIFVHSRKAFLPYIEGSTAKLNEAVNHFYEGVRKSAVSSLYRFVATLYSMSNPAQWRPGFSSESSLPADVAPLTDTVRATVLDLLQIEDEKIVVMEVFRNLAETLRLCGPALLGSSDELEALCNNLVAVLKGEHACQEDDAAFAFGNDAGPADEDEDDVFVEADESSEYEAMLLDAAADVVIALASTLKASFETPFGIFLPLVERLARSQNSSERATAVATLGEVAAGLGQHVSVYTDRIFSCLMNGLGDNDREVRSNSAYAVGLLCQFSSQDLTPQYLSILQKLQPLFAGDNHRFAKDNAIGCTARMILARREAVPMAQVLPVVVANLPLTEDFAENTPVYKMLCALLKAGDATALAHIDALLPVFASVLSAQPEQLTGEARSELTEVCRELQAQRGDFGLASFL
ncbi:hypothetical protein PYCC9005_004719 [Savitreella phatthalungensis]